MPAVPYGAGPPGCPPWSGEASRSWCRVAAGGLVGWRVSWVRAWLPGWSRGRAWAGRAASSGAERFPVARLLARWPSPRRPSTSAAAWCPVAFWWCSRKGASQCSRPPPRAVSRINNHDRQARVGSHLHQAVARFPAGMPATARRNPRPRLPREGLVPWRSRPSARASAKSRSSITIARAPCRAAVAMMVLIAARSRPSRVAAGSPVRSRPAVAGVPRTLPSGATAATARCPAFTSTATTGFCPNSSSVAAAAGAVFQLASIYHLSRAGSQATS